MFLDLSWGQSHVVVSTPVLSGLDIATDPGRLRWRGLRRRTDLSRLPSGRSGQRVSHGEAELRLYSERMRATMMIVTLAEVHP